MHGTPNPSIAWLLDGRTILESERHSMVEHRDGTRQLIVHQPTGASNGRYECIATNAVREVRSNLSVDITPDLERYAMRMLQGAVATTSIETEDSAAVEAVAGGLRHKLAFETQLKNVTVREGRSVKFICSVRGSVSERQVHWMHDGRRLDFSCPGAGAALRYRSTFSSGLIILEIDRVRADEDAGEFTCTVSKGATEIASTAKLFVYERSDADMAADVASVPPAFVRSLTGWAIGEESASFYQCMFLRSFRCFCPLLHKYHPSPSTAIIFRIVRRDQERTDAAVRRQRRTAQDHLVQRQLQHLE